MPIKPENKERYPEDWPERRARVLERACHRCELCGAPDRKPIQRPYGDGRWFPVAELTDGTLVPLIVEGKTAKVIKVILTIAHLDPTYQSHDEKHLLALCQRCHLKIDAPLRGRKKVRP